MSHFQPLDLSPPEARTFSSLSVHARSGALVFFASWVRFPKVRRLKISSSTKKRLKIMGHLRVPPPPPKATPAKKSALWKFRSFFWGGNQWVNNLLIGPYLLEGVLKKDWRGTFNFPSEDLGKPGLFFGKKTTQWHSFFKWLLKTLHSRWRFSQFSP